MDWQARYYPTDVFPTLVKQMGELVVAGRLQAPMLVREEIEAVGTADLVQWVKNNPAMLVKTVKVLAEAQAIQNRFPGLRDPKAEHEEADAYVIALARMRSGIVLTQETSATEKNKPKRTHFIPDVCRELGIPCVSLLGMMRRENWRF